MIRAAVGGDFLLIPQHDHARLSGAMAARIGNEVFARPTSESIEAIGLHDAGWPLHDETPTLNPQGLPLNVFETPAGIATRVWSESARRAAEAGPYAQLLVSVHVISLAAMALGSKSLSRMDQFTLLKFQQQEAERQASLRKSLGLSTALPLHDGLAKPGTSDDEDGLVFHYGLLRAVDRLSLEACFGGGVFKAIDHVQPGPGAATVDLKLTSSPVSPPLPPGEGIGGGAAVIEIHIDPWPFDAETLAFQVPFRRVAARPFNDVETFRVAYESAGVETLDVRLLRDANAARD